MAPGGRPRVALTPPVEEDPITSYEVIVAGPVHPRRLHLAVQGGRAARARGPLRRQLADRGP